MQRERNRSKERETGDQMKRVIRGIAPEPLLCHPELVSGSHYNEIPKQVRNDNIRKIVGRFGNVVSDNSSHSIKRVFLFRFYFFFLHRNQKEKVNKKGESNYSHNMIYVKIILKQRFSTTDKIFIAGVNETCRFAFSTCFMSSVNL